MGLAGFTPTAAFNEILSALNNPRFLLIYIAVAFCFIILDNRKSANLRLKLKTKKPGKLVYLSKKQIA